MNSDHVTISHRGEKREIETVFHHTGENDNPVLVFLHEGLGCVKAWKDFPRTLGRLTQCNALVYSRLGYGNSSAIPLPRKINWLHTEALDLLPQVLKASGVTRYIHIGHSDGGSIALIHGGGRRPKGLRGIVTLAAHLFCEPVTLAAIRRAKDWYETGDLKQRLERFHGKNTDTAFWGWNQTWLAPGFVHWNIEKYLNSIHVPVLAIQGKDDPYGTLSQLTALEQGLKTCTTAVIEDCGHAPHIEQGEKTLGLISGFISKSMITPRPETDRGASPED